MSPDLVKLMPPMLVLTGAGLCLWPYLEVQLPPAPSTISTLKIDPDRLDPTVGPASPRDPFRLAGEVGPAPAPVASANEKPAASEPETTSAPRPKSPAGLNLQATLIGRGRRSAVINNRIYDQGATIDLEGEHEGPWQLAWIDRDRVLLNDEAGENRAALALHSRPPFESVGDSEAAEWPEIDLEALGGLISRLEGLIRPESGLGALWKQAESRLRARADFAD